ncbi:MAG TPA: hypothetical protein VK212_03875 [Lentimicrobium sp.]|nr:hypothetical protein [Lentimicrobium sp.]
MLRRVLTLILLLIFLYNAGGYYLCFRYYQHVIRREMKHMVRKEVSSDQLTEIIVPVSNTGEQGREYIPGIVWIKPGKEFSYQNKMFDVVRSTIKGDKKHYLCINDKKEKKLLAELIKLKTRRLEKRLKSAVTYYSLPECIRYIDPGVVIRFTPLASFYHSVSHEILSPPPPVL